MLNIHIPQHAQTAMEALTHGGYQAFAVGGCIRDAILGLPAHDWDIATDATPRQIKAVFESERTVDTGLRHGTVTVFLGGQGVEITTFRVDGGYTDGRRPDTVEFSADIRQDLARRDFSINAMAFDGKQLTDPFGGRADIENRIICAVGDPQARFREDGLRIMRGLRFASRLGFKIEPATAKAMGSCAFMLQRVSAERIRDELCGLLTGQQAAKVMEEYVDILKVIIPEIIPMVGFYQHSRHHIYDVWRHTLAAIDASPPVLVTRLALLLHDIGKPGCFSMDDAGAGHFYGHGKRSHMIAQEVLDRLRFDNATRDQVLKLVYYHDSDLLASDKSLRRWLIKLGAENLRLLLDVKRADNLAQSPVYHEPRQRELDKAQEALERLLEAEGALSLRDLDIDGNDIMALGAHGSQIGRILAYLLDEVAGEACQNKKPALVKRAVQMLEAISDSGKQG